jgi:hypothetical protein
LYWEEVLYNAGGGMYIKLFFVNNNGGAVAGNDGDGGAVFADNDGSIAASVTDILFFLFHQLIRYLRLLALGSK